MPERLAIAIAGLGLVCGSLAVLAGDGRLPAAQSLRSWLTAHNFSGEGVIEYQARNASFSFAPEGREAAVAIYRTLLERDPANPYRWCDLGEALQAAGSAEAADRAIRRAVKLGSALPPVLIRAANFYFAIGDRASAVPLYRAVLALVHDYDFITFLTYTRLGLTPGEVIRAGLPLDKESARNYLTFLYARGDAAGAEAAWKWARANHLADAAAAENHVDFLLNQQKTAQAAAAWAGYLGGRRGDYLAPNYVYNGGFGNDLTQSRLDWRIQPLEGAESTLEPAQKSGGRYLRVQFAGEKNLSFHHVTQTLWLPPGTYRFHASVRSEALTTNKGVQFHLTSGGGAAFDFYSEPVLGTTPWHAIEHTLTVPACKSVVLEVVRRESEKFDSKIHGTIWIAGVSLLRTAPWFPAPAAP